MVAASTLAWNPDTDSPQATAPDWPAVKEREVRLPTGADGVASTPSGAT